jgi:hypothetical protein
MISSAKLLFGKFTMAATAYGDARSLVPGMMSVIVKTLNALPVGEDSKFPDCVLHTKNLHAKYVKVKLQRPNGEYKELARKDYFIHHPWPGLQALKPGATSSK